MLTLILGGARSGKSRYAQLLCADRRQVLYVATAAHDANDAEMSARIERHRRERPAEWQTLEAPLAVATAIAEAEPSTTVLIDCATVWLSNLMWEHRALEIAERQNMLLDEVAKLAAAVREREVILVSNEVGGGIVPDNQVAREFRDLQGAVNQLFAREAARVVLVVAGLPLVLKDEQK